MKDLKTPTCTSCKMFTVNMVSYFKAKRSTTTLNLLLTLALLFASTQTVILTSQFKLVTSSGNVADVSSGISASCQFRCARSGGADVTTIAVAVTDAPCTCTHRDAPWHLTSLPENGTLYLWKTHFGGILNPPVIFFHTLLK